MWMPELLRCGNTLEGTDVTQSVLDKVGLELILTSWLEQPYWFQQQQRKFLQLEWSYSVHQYRLETRWLEKKIVGFCWTSSCMGQCCTRVLMKAHSVLSCTGESIASKSREMTVINPLALLCRHLEYFVLFWCLSVMEILKIRCRRPPTWWGGCSTQGAKKSWKKRPPGPPVSRKAKTVLGSDCSLQVPRGWLWRRPKQTLQDAQCKDEMTIARCSKRNSS